MIGKQLLFERAGHVTAAAQIAMRHCDELGKKYIERRERNQEHGVPRELACNVRAQMTFPQSRKH
jgi:hypothetical protein